MILRLRTFLDQVATWPRAMQWAFWATSITIAFLVWDTTIADIGAKWSARADTIERQISEINQPILLTSSLRNAMSAFGEVELPREKSQGASAMTDAVHNILANHAVKNDEYTRTKTTRMRSGSLPGIGRVGQSIEQVIGNIRFEATQEEVLMVISDLESSPWIDGVSDVRLTKQDGRMIRVDLSVEAWVVSDSSRRNRR
jgi:hypothetical protein